MSTKIITGFETQAAAEAFRDGMYYVNDSAIEDIEVIQTKRWGGGEWAVRFEDTDEWEEMTLPYEPGNMGA